MTDIRSLHYFRSVIDHGSLRAAAEAIGLTQPALSKAIRRLEDRFGVSLFDRTNQGVTLTTFGHALLRHARDIDASLKSATEEISSLRQGISGIIRLGAGPSWQGAILPEAVVRLRQERPGILVKIFGGSDDHLKHLLKEGAIDLVLAAVPDASAFEPDLAWEPLLEDEYIVIADEGHPLFRLESVTWPELLNFPWILPPSTTYMVERLHFLLRSKRLPPPQAAVETDAIQLRFALMKDSLYLSLNARTHLESQASSNIRILNAPYMPLVRRAGLITRQGVTRSPAELLMIDHLRLLCEERSRELRKR